MSRGSWAKRNEWDDKNSYFFGINASYFSSNTTAEYIPLVGSIGESADSTNVLVQFIPPGSGRLLSLTTYSSNSSAPGSTVVSLTQNGGAGDIGSKTITISSQTVESFDFKDDLTSGTMEWDINDGSSLAIKLDPTLALNTCNVFALFEIYK